MKATTKSFMFGVAVGVAVYYVYNTTQRGGE